MHRPLSGRPSTSNLEILTPNQKDNIVKNERTRRRIIRYIQVRQQSNENALKIREKVKAEKNKEIELIKEELTNAIARRQCMRRVLSPTQPNATEQIISPPLHRQRKLTEKEIRLIEQRHRDALLKMRRQQNERKAKISRAINLRKRAVREANLRSKHNFRCVQRSE